MLAEEELIAIDLTKNDWPSYSPPYLASPHASAITCSTCAENISDQIWNKIKDAAEASKTKAQSSSVSVFCNLWTFPHYFKLFR